MTSTATPAALNTHERYLHQVRDLVIADALDRGAIDTDEAAKLHHTKLVYGVGNGTYRGVCHYAAWQNGVGPVDVVEIAATAEESWTQLAGTVIHELGHVLTGHGAGHGSDWKAAAVRLGFTIRPLAAGQRYYLAMIRPSLRTAIYRAALLVDDGTPGFGRALMPVAIQIRPCNAGRGVKGGTSHGAGSGRLRLWECSCPKPVKVRVSSDDFQATCDRCGTAFVQIVKQVA